MADAVLFDVDGTLVDSNYLHVDAWTRALARAGHGVDAWRVHRAIGMDSTALLQSLLGERADALGERAKQLHEEFFEERSSGLTALSGARDLVAEVARRGQKAVLATSAPESELASLRRVLDVEGDLFATTSSKDVATAKPAPDIVKVALERAGVTAGDAVFVGDSLWDVEAAVRAGVRCVALLTGGTGRLELLDAGADSVWDDPAHLLAHYDEAL
jgi:HAD superfamily hydrolase (TIGR01509 family)